jgi:hypothetical protein
MLENPGAPVAICALGRKRGIFVLVVDKIEEEDSATNTPHPDPPIARDHPGPSDRILNYFLDSPNADL